MSFDAMSDDELLKVAGHLGPSMIGQAAYDRLVRIKSSNPTGIFGRTLLGPAFDQPPTADVVADDEQPEPEAKPKRGRPRKATAE